MPEPSAGVWTLIQLKEPLDDWTGASFMIRCLGAPGGVACTIGGIGEEEIANAHLICAAKEMYEALNDCRRWLDGVLSIYGPECLGECKPVNCMGLNDIKNVLAKATVKP